MRIFDADASVFHALNAPGRGPKEEDIAGMALNREVFVERANQRAFRLGNDLKLRRLGNRAAVGDGDEPRAAASFDHAVDLVAMEHRTAASAHGGDAFGQNLDHRIEAFSSQIAIRIRGAHHREEFFLVPFAGCSRGDQLLSQDVERRIRDLDFVENPGADGADHRGAFDQFVTRRAEEPALGQRSHPVTGAADALQGGGDGARRSDLADQVHRADIDAQFQRRSGDDRAQFAALETLLGFQAQRTRQASMMRQDGGFAQAFGKMMRYFFRKPARVDEHQRGAMFQRQVRQAVVDVLPHLIAGDRVQFVARDFDRQVHGPAMADLDDLRIAAEELRDLFNRADRGRKTNLLERALNQRFEPGDRQCEMRAALRSGDGVNFVEDQRLHAAQHFAPAFRRQQDEKRFGRRHQNMRRVLHHL